MRLTPREGAIYRVVGAVRGSNDCAADRRNRSLDDEIEGIVSVPQEGVDEFKPARQERLNINQ
jgi:hypothetical protein